MGGGLCWEQNPVCSRVSACSCWGSEASGFGSLPCRGKGDWQSCQSASKSQHRRPSLIHRAIHTPKSAHFDLFHFSPLSSLPLISPPDLLCAKMSLLCHRNFSFPSEYWCFLLRGGYDMLNQSLKAMNNSHYSWALFRPALFGFVLLSKTIPFSKWIQILLILLMSAPLVNFSCFSPLLNSLAEQQVATVGITQWIKAGGGGGGGPFLSLSSSLYSPQISPRYLFLLF